MFDGHLVDRIGWTLIHSVWQIVLLAYLVALCNRFLFRRSAPGRYVVGCIALLLMIAAPLATFCLVSPPGASSPSDDLMLKRTGLAEAAAVSSAVTGSPAATRSTDPRSFEAATTAPDDAVLHYAQDERPEGTVTHDLEAGDGETHASLSGVFDVWRDRATTWLQPAVSSLVAIWFVGVLVLSVRPLFGLYTVHRLRHLSRDDVPEKVHALVRRLCARMGIDKTIELAESALVDVPAVVGSLRPLLLLPVSAVTGLTPQQLEAVIAHELAHVRRHDYLVNFLQTIVETLLFYHPAVWWVSAQVKRERENCCDDIAVAVCSDRAVYAKTLVALDELRGRVPQAAIGANGGSLLQRIRRLTGRPGQQHPATTWLASAMLLIAVLVTAASLVTVPDDAVAEDATKTNVRLKLRDHHGRRLTQRVDFQTAWRGYRKGMRSETYTSDDRGNLNIDLPPGKHVLITNAHMPNATVIELDVPEKGLRRKQQLGPMPPSLPGRSGYPDLDVKCELGEQTRRGEELILVTISNNKEEAYELHANDLAFTNDDTRVLPPKSQQRAGFVIPPKSEGDKTIKLRWNDYVHAGIWSSRYEAIAEPAMPQEAKPGRTWFALRVANTRSLPIEVAMPEVILDPDSIDPRTLATHTGGLRGRFAFDGKRPERKRIRPYPPRSLDGRVFDIPKNHFLNKHEVFDESLVVDEDGGVANVVVWVRSPDIPAPLVDKHPVSLRMAEGRYQPHVMVVETGQHLVVTNEHDFATNWHIEPFGNELLNMVVGKDTSVNPPRFKQPESIPTRMRSDLHPWLSGWLIVRDNPFFAVSSEDGTFEIKGLPPGEWEFQFWHEKAGFLRREDWPKGRVKLKIDDGTYDLGTVKLTAKDLKLDNDQAVATAAPARTDTGPPGFTGALTGRFVFDGVRPRQKVFEARKDAAFMGRHVLLDESLIVGEDGGIENVIVWARTPDMPVPPQELAATVTLRTDGGRFNPHVATFQSRQKLVIENKDPVAYNFNVQTIRQPGVNLLLPPQNGRAEMRFKETALPVPVSCNIHPWMAGWLFVRDNPYFAVTGKDGNFTLKSLPPGEWEFTFWHEKTGYVKHKSGWNRGRHTVKIGPGASQLGTIELTYEDFDLNRPTGDQAVGEFSGDHPVWIAAQGGDKELILQILKRQADLINWRNHTGFAPLHWAAMQESADAAELLLTVGADVSVRHAKFGGTPLQYAAGKGHLDICRLLISYDAPVDSVDVFGRTSLIWAAMYGHVDVVKLLIESGADINAKTSKSAPSVPTGVGSSAIDIAKNEGHDEVVQLLLDHGARPTPPPKASRRPQIAPQQANLLTTWFRDAPCPQVGFPSVRETDRLHVLLAADSDVHDDLNATEDQRAVLSRLREWTFEDLRDINGNDDQRQRVWAKASNRVRQILEVKQWSRLKQLGIQQRRTEAFRYPELVPILKITEQQREKIEAAWQAHLKRVAAYRKLESSDRAARGQESHRRCWDDIYHILTDQQRARFVRLRGPPIGKGTIPKERAATKPVPKIRGIVTQVGEGQQFVLLSIGKDDGLEAGMQLVVSRENTYVGRLAIRKVESDQSVAEILKEYKREDVLPGDRVTPWLETKASGGIRPFFGPNGQGLSVGPGSIPAVEKQIHD